MSSFEKDKAAERDRYDRRAHSLLSAQQNRLGPDGALSQPLVLRRPYLVFEDFILRSTPQGAATLDVCCGTGLYSLIAARAGARVSASDIAKHNVMIAERRAERAGIHLRGIVADAEHIPCNDGEFDLVTCAGSLSYVDLSGFLREISRLLRPGGWFVCVDSLNHNPIYRANRYWNFFRGRRTRSTMLRMPTLSTIAEMKGVFEQTETSFHGTLSFLAPLLRAFAGEPSTARWLDNWDLQHPSWQKWAFKFVFRGRKPL